MKELCKMSQVPQQGFVPEKVQEFNRRASQDLSDSPIHKSRNPSQESTPRKEPLANEKEKKITTNSIEKNGPSTAKDQKTHDANFSPAHGRQDNKNPFSPHFYRSSRPQGHFEMGPRGLDYSPHRMGLEFPPQRMRDYGPQRSTSVHGHDFIDGPNKPEYLGHRAHFGSQIVPGGISSAHPDVVFRHDYYAQMGFSPPRASRFSSQEYLNAPAQYGRWPDYRTEYRQRRRSQQDLHSLGQSTESGIIDFFIINVKTLFFNIFLLILIISTVCCLLLNIIHVKWLVI